MWKSALNSTLLLLHTFIFLLSSQYVYADHNARSFESVKVDGSHERSIHSKAIDQEYKLLINLPRNYDSSRQDYPVIYLLDAQWDFTALVSMYGQLYYDGDMPEVIIVGVTWGGEKPIPSQLRIRDFSPSVMDAYPNSGGANKFLEFFKSKLIPFVEKEYRASEQRILMGSSLGGLFTTYAMFTSPALFDIYIPTAIATHWDDEVVFKYAEAFVQNTNIEKDLRMYSAVGDLDSLSSSNKRLYSYLEKEKPAGLTLKFETFANIGHSAIKSIGNLRGLQTVYAKKEVTLSRKQLMTFTGVYKSNDGVTVTVELEDDRLMITNPEGSKDHFKAMSENTFFIPGYYETVSFKVIESKSTVKMKVVFFEGEIELYRTEK